jgi:hypothetical protein
MSEDDEVPIDLPSFDERTTRAAVRRAILRTALTAAAGILALLVVAGLASGLWSARSDERLRFVMGRAYQSANPGYLVTFASGPRSRLDFGTDLKGAAQALEPGGFSNVATAITVQQNFYGRVTKQTILPPTHIDELFCCVGRSDKDRAAELLKTLPEGVAFSALVELKTPLDETTFTTFRHRLGICGRNIADALGRFQDSVARETKEISGCGSARENSQTAVLAAMVLSPTPQDRANRLETDVDGAHRLTWPDFSLIEFNRWASALRKSDEPNIRKLLLPKVDEIKRRAREGKVYGFIVTGLRPERLRALLNALELGDITIADVALAIA